MKRKISYILATFFIFLFISNIRANTISSIDMDIKIDESGTAHVTEIWKANLNQGTEGYRAYDNLGNANITNFKVIENNIEYQTLSSWDSNDSFDEKAYKAGICNQSSNYVELCWGISKYGSHEYVLSYDIEGFVVGLNDSQMVYWQLIPNELAKQTRNVSIKIYSDFEYPDTLDVWGYGNYGGYAYVYDGYIEMSNESLDSDEYMTILVKFDSDTFNTINVIDKDFNYYYEMAEDGAEHYIDNSNSFGHKLMNFIIGMISVLWNLFIWLIIIFALVKSSKNSGLKSGKFTLDFGEKGKKLPKDVNMFRDIPCNKDIYRAYWVAYNYNLMKKQTDFLGVILLKWLKEKHIKIESKTVGKVFKKEDTTIIFEEQTPAMATELEYNLYKYMKEASKDNILESKEFEKWCTSHYSTILNWFDKVLDYENEKLVQEGKLEKTERVDFKIFKSTVYKVDPLMYDEAIQMKGLKEFFNYFSNMKDKEAIEVNLWEEYLMYAQIFGVADKVAKQFKELYPDVITDYDYDSIIFVNTISYSGMNSATSARSRAQSYSSGGGGFSSGGGGGGSFGGGGSSGGGFR